METENGGAQGQRCSTNCLKHIIHPRRLPQMFGQSVAAVFSVGAGGVLTYSSRAAVAARGRSP